MGCPPPHCCRRAAYMPASAAPSLSTARPAAAREGSARLAFAARARTHIPCAPPPSSACCRRLAPSRRRCDDLSPFARRTIRPPFDRQDQDAQHEDHQQAQAGRRRREKRQPPQERPIAQRRPKRTSLATRNRPRRRDRPRPQKGRPGPAMRRPESCCTRVGRRQNCYHWRQPRRGCSSWR